MKCDLISTTLLQCLRNRRRFRSTNNVFNRPTFVSNSQTMSSYAKHFEDLAKAIESLEVFPNIIREFTNFLKQRYLKKHKLSELVWIHELCGEYEDSCKGYTKFIKRVIGSEFLARCLHVKNDEIDSLIKELKANINAANKRLNNFLGETERKEVVEKLDVELTKMESAKAKKDKKDKYMMKFGDWLKGEVLEQVGEVFAKVVGPLWDFVYTNASEAIRSDYDHDILKMAVEQINSAIPKMEESLDLNRRALRGIDSIVDVFAKLHEEKDSDLEKEFWRLSPMQHDIDNACDRITKEVEKLKNV